MDEYLRALFGVLGIRKGHLPILKILLKHSYYSEGRREVYLNNDVKNEAREKFPKKSLTEEIKALKEAGLIARVRDKTYSFNPKYFNWEKDYREITMCFQADKTEVVFS